MLNDQLLSAYIDTFYGYGTYAAPYWFVGMEEGGGNSLDEVAERINVWNNRGRCELRDPRGYDYDPITSTSPWFRRNPKSQTTWRQLIRMALVAQDISPSLNGIKAYQRDRLGRPDGDICLLELLPLPSPSIGHWHYSAFASLLPYLSSRAAYMEHCAPFRAARVRARIEQHTPKAVIFYSFNWWYRHWWAIIAGVPFNRVEAPGGDIFLGTSSTTTFAIVKHPASRGIPNQYYEEVGKLLVKTGR
jgi:hypothetical protein